MHHRYFKQPYYDEEAAVFAEKAKQPFGFTEFFTFPLGNGGNFGKYQALLSRYSVTNFS